MSFLFVPVLFIMVLMEKIGMLKTRNDRTDEEREKIAQSQFKSNSAIINVVLELFEMIERGLMRKSDRVPFGSSIIVVAKIADI